AYLGPVGQYVANRQPDFDPRNYGFRKLAELIRSCGWFEVEERSSPTDTGKQIYIRKRQGR
nr:OST-HTH/LOTUS domain-containing protein [Spirochaetales bacterium]